MGRQIGLFMVDKDLEAFSKIIHENGGVLIDVKGSNITINEILQSTRSAYYIKNENSNIIFTKNCIVDVISSDIIELSRSMIDKDNHVEHGRIWYQTQYYDTMGVIKKKHKWLIDQYNNYKKWILKNYMISKCRDFYIGEEAYKLYKSGEYKMMATPVTEVHFD